MKWLFYLAIFVIVLSLTNTADYDDWVDQFLLPIGFSVNNFYAGYLKVSEVKSFYYVYTPSYDNPTKDPLVIMISHGPGCSNLHSFLYTKGYFIFVRNTSNFRHNPNNWNKIANVLYIEGPAGVGFAMGDDYVVSDDSLQKDFFAAILSFYAKFPERRSTYMFLTGMQYAGILAPRLALNIIDHNRNPDTSAWLKVNLTGLLLLNPCTLGDECNHINGYYTSYTIDNLHNNYFISSYQYADYKAHCTFADSRCFEIKTQIKTQFQLTGADLRNLYKDCLIQSQPGDLPPCVDHYGIDIFLNVPTVRQDMHANKDITWHMCNASVEAKYLRDGDGSLKIYYTLLMEEHNLRIWILSGTLSASVPTIGTKKWIGELRANMGLPTTRMWYPWFHQTVNAGDVYEMRGLTFVTIRAAGFYMFDDQPYLSYHVYESFLTNTPL